MLFKTRFHEGIRNGAIRCTVRIWQRPHVKVGGRYTLGAVAVVVERIYESSLDDVSPALARSCGFDSVADLVKTAKHGPGERVFIIDFHYDACQGARPALQTGPISAEEIAVLVQKLEGMDRRSKIGAWSVATLREIQARPGVSAAKLARSFGRPREDFKRDVRKLNNLGLTFSLETGYRLTPKGEALLGGLSSHARARRSRK